MNYQEQLKKMRIGPKQRIVLIAVAAAAVLLAAPVLLLALTALGITILAVPSWRLRLISKPIFRQLKKSISAVSSTEREAIKAGTMLAKVHEQP